MAISESCSLKLGSACEYAEWSSRGHAARFSTLHTYAATNVHLIREGSAASESPAAPHPGHVTASVRSVSPAGRPVIGRNTNFISKHKSRFSAIEMLNHRLGLLPAR